MDFKIEKQENKPLVDRIEITLKITKIEATPSNVQVQEALAKLTNKNKDLIVVKHINQKFGMDECVVFAYIYTNPESLKKFETKNKKSKEEEKKIKEEIKPEEKEPEKKEEKKEKPAEKPKEESKEEPKEKAKEKPKEEKTEEKKPEPKSEEKTGAK